MCENMEGGKKKVANTREREGVRRKFLGWRGGRGQNSIRKNARSNDDCTLTLFRRSD